MDAIKDHANLARAFVLALRINPAAARDMRLVIVGDGVARRESEQILAEAGLSELVWFAGKRTDVADVMRGFDCFVLPSRGEGISTPSWKRWRPDCRSLPLAWAAMRSWSRTA